MKRLFLIPMLMVMCHASAWAVSPTSTSRITLSTAGEADKQVNFFIHSSLSDAFETTYDAVAFNPGGIYVYSGGERYETWASNGYTANLAIGFGAVAGKTSYTLTFSNFTGETYQLYDLVASEVITVNGSTPAYNFTTDSYGKDTEIYDRFVLNKPVPAGNLETCFTGTELQITNNPIFGKIVVKRKSDKSTVHEYEFGTSSITMNTSTGYADGDYIVEFGSGASQRSFIVTVKN